MTTGEAAYELMERLFPLCRSLTGDGVRATFDVLAEHIPIARTEVPSGTQVFDWTVPDEWNIREAYVAAPDGTRVVDFRDSSLHVVSYSEPVRATLPLEELRERLFTLPDQPDLIPYRTSYYARTWGFCLPHRRLLELEPGDYEVRDRLDARARPPHVRRAGARGRHGRRGPDLDLRLPPVARQRQPVGHRGRDDAGEGALARDGCATPIASCSLPARSARWRGCTATATGSTGSCTGSRSRASATAATSRTSAAGAATRTSTAPSRPCCATRASRTGCSSGSRGAATSASSARPASTCRSAR